MHAAEATPQRVLHCVVVYADPLELVRTIGEFSVAALERGGAVVLLAQREHLEAADEWVRLSDSLVSAEGTVPTYGRYQTFDVDDVIRELNLSPEPCHAFEGLLDSACKRIPTGREVVHVFGDLMGTLWERRQVDLALEIEAMGGQLASERGIPVLCSYPASALADTGDAESILGCHTHLLPRSTVAESKTAGSLASTGQPAAPASPSGKHRESPDVTSRSKVFPASIPACRAARQFVRATVEDAGNDSEITDAAELVCSELAANAVRHAHSVFTVRVDCSDGGVRVAVADESEPSHAHTGDEEPDPFPVRTARGLGIVSALSDDWGVEKDAPGKTVWAELGHTRGAA